MLHGTFTIIITANNFQRRRVVRVGIIGNIFKFLGNEESDATIIICNIRYYKYDKVYNIT